MLTVGQQVVIDQFAKQLIQRITQAITSKPIKRTSVRYEKGKRITNNFTSHVNASGDLIRSLRYEISDEGLTVYAADYVYYLIYGRKPTKASGSGTVKSEILKWIRAKNISSELSNETLAFLIARKIHREGSSIYLANKGNDSGLLTNVLNEQIYNEFNDKFTAQLVEELNYAFDNAD